MKGLTSFMLIFFNFSLMMNAQNGFTQADRERLLRLEIQMSEGFKRIDARLDMMQKQIDENSKQIENNRLEIGELHKEIAEVCKEMTEFRNANSIMVITLFGMLFTGYIALFGYIFWDRKTAVKNVENEQVEMKIELSKYKEKISLHERIFKEVSSGKALTPELLHQYGI